MNLKNFGVETNKNNNKSKEIIDSKLNLNTKEIAQKFKLRDIETYLPWFLKYELNDYKDLIITSQIRKIIDFIETFQTKNSKKAILLSGPAGSGKTTTLTLLGNHYNYEIFELNASDNRNKKSIEETVGIAIKQKSLFGKNKLILIDEADGVSGREDRGGISALAKIIKESNYPIAFTANDGESEKIKAIKKLCIYIDFENHSQELLLKIGMKILKAENIKYKKEELKEFIRKRNETDIRGFINDLQALSYDNELNIQEDLELRDYKKKLEALLNKIYFSYPEDSFKSGYNTDINLDELFLYLEENTPDTYSKTALINALNEISKADIFRGRITKWQHWRFLVYINFYLTYAVSNAKDTPQKIDKYRRNRRILTKWIYANKVNSLSQRTKLQKKNNDPEKLIEKLSKLYKRSAKKTRAEDLFYFTKIYQNNKQFQKEMDKILQINDSEKKVLLEL